MNDAAEEDPIRQRSIVELRRYGVSYPTHLPLMGELHLRPAREIQDRALTLAAVIAASFGFPKSSALEWLEREGLSTRLAPVERSFLEHDREEAQQFHFQVERLYMIAWALNIAPLVPYDEECPNELVRQFPDLKRGEGSSAFRARAVGRPESDIVQQCDIAYGLDWLVANSRLLGENVRALGPIVTHRRFALEWTLSEQDWGDVSLDT